MARRAVTAPFCSEIEIKKSRFVTHVAPAETPDAAMDFLAAVRDPKATHNCFAYRIGPAFRFSDDGEPGGTAGRPMLSAIDGAGFDRVVAVVTRYFGGIKLGAGGLVRAYGRAVAECLRDAPSEEIVDTACVDVHVPFAVMGAAHAVLDRMGGTKTAERFDETGVYWSVRIPVSREQALRAALVEATSGTCRIDGVPP